MRGADEQQSQIFSYLSPEARVRKDHPLRAIRAMVDEVLGQLSGAFDAMYASVGRPSIAPEKLLRAQLLQMLYSVRSERLLIEEMDYNLLFRWFVGLNADDDVWDATTFAKNRDRLLQADVAKQFLAQVVAQAGSRGLTSDEHFTVDGTLCATWRPQFRWRKPGPRCVWWGIESGNQAERPEKHQKSTRSNISSDEKRQAKHSRRQFFSSLLGLG